MTTQTLWHNPRCSKSRQTLALLEEHGVSPEIVRYLDTPPSREELARVAGLLGGPEKLLRKKEDGAKEAAAGGEEAILDAMAADPKLIERPVFIAGGRAAIGRPPEDVLALLDA